MQVNLRDISITLAGIHEPNITCACEAVSAQITVKDAEKPTPLSSIFLIVHPWHGLNDVTEAMAVPGHLRGLFRAFPVTLALCTNLLYARSCMHSFSVLWCFECVQSFSDKLNTPLSMRPLDNKLYSFKNALLA